MPDLKLPTQAPASAGDTSAPTPPTGIRARTARIPPPRGMIAACTLLTALVILCLIIAVPAWIELESVVFAVVGTLGVVLSQIVGSRAEHQILDWPTVIQVSVTPVLGVFAVLPAADHTTVVIVCCGLIIASTALRLNAFRRH